MIFPKDTIEPEIERENTLPVYADWAYNYTDAKLDTDGGRNYVQNGLKALQLSIYKALSTPRNRYSAYTSDYGQDFSRLVGVTDFEYVKEALTRYITEALAANPYIKGLLDFRFERNGSEITVNFTAETVYGKSQQETKVSI